MHERTAEQGGGDGTRRGLWLLVVAALAACACGRGAAPAAEGDESSELAVASSDPAGGGFATRSGPAVTGGTSVAAEEEDGEDEDEKDYWREISFDRANFEEVRQQIARLYIDAKHDEPWGYAQAAAFAVGSHPERGLMILPESFWQARKDDPDEKGLLKGRMFKLAPTDAFVLLEESKEKPEESKKRLSDDEIRGLRERLMKRTRDLHTAWTAMNFSGRDFDRVMGFIAREFKQDDKWTLKHAWVAAAQGYLFSLDPHSSLVSKVAWDDSTRKTEDSSFQGIGAVLTQRPDSDYVIVESPMQGSPAVKAGVRAGDMILAVDDTDIKGESLSKVVSRIRGPAGVVVKLRIQREGEPDPRNIPITRAKIEVKNVSGRLIEHHEGLAYIKVTGYIRTTDEHFTNELERLTNEAPGRKLRGLVLDLRNNSGGLLNQGIRMADHFLTAGKTIVSVKNRNAAEDEVYNATGGDLTSIPVVVLVNDGSASAAEIVASALQDNQRALVVGDRTFGKASVQTLFPPLLQDDYYIKLTVARYYSPSGRTLQVTGVTPDLVVPPEYNGKMPLGFREENLSGHLVPIDGDYVSPNAALTGVVEACIAKRGRAKTLVEADPNPAVKFDWQLMVGADAVTCLGASASAAR
jgi:C-terminal peptidase prc